MYRRFSSVWPGRRVLTFQKHLPPHINDGGNRFLWNVSTLPPDLAALHPRSQFWPVQRLKLFLRYFRYLSLVSAYISIYNTHAVLELSKHIIDTTIIIISSSSTALGRPWASSSKCRQWLLSWAAVKQFSQPSFFASSSTPSIHLAFGRPRPRLPPGFVHYIFSGNKFPSIRATWPAHLNLPDFITLTIFGLLQRSADSLLYLFPHCPFTHIGPYILRRIFLSKIL